MSLTECNPRVLIVVAAALMLIPAAQVSAQTAGTPAAQSTAVPYSALPRSAPAKPAP